MPFRLLLYRLSGWFINLVTIFIAYKSIKTNAMWKGRYLFMAIGFCVSAVFEFLGSITALLMTNNLFIDYLYIPLDFILSCLYLQGQYKSNRIKIFTVGIIVLFLALQVYKAVDQEGYLRLNAIGSYASSVILFSFSLVNLTKLFKERRLSGKLRQNPDFWFTATLFCICAMSIFVTVLADATYAAGSAKVFYPLYISQNILYACLLYGYYKGIKLLR